MLDATRAPARWYALRMRHRGLAAFILVAVLLSAAPALATVPEPYKCLFTPESSCDVTALVEWGFSGGGAYTDGDWQRDGRLFVAGGMLIKAGESGTVHPGFTVDFAFDRTHALEGKSFGVQFRNRVWFVEHLTFDAALGPRFESLDLSESGAKEAYLLGGSADLGFSVHGVVGVYGAVSLLGGVEGFSGPDLRLVAGVRCNLTMAIALAVSALGR